MHQKSRNFTQIIRAYDDFQCHELLIHNWNNGTFSEFFLLNAYAFQSYGKSYGVIYGYQFLMNIHVFIYTEIVKQIGIQLYFWLFLELCLICHSSKA